MGHTGIHIHLCYLLLIGIADSLKALFHLDVETIFAGELAVEGVLRPGEKVGADADGQGSRQKVIQPWAEAVIAEVHIDRDNDRWVEVVVKETCGEAQKALETLPCTLPYRITSADPMRIFCVNCQIDAAV
jgi:hypothetical protein